MPKLEEVECILKAWDRVFNYEWCCLRGHLTFQFLVFEIKFFEEGEIECSNQGEKGREDDSRSQLDYSDIYKTKERTPRVMTEKRRESKKKTKRKKRAEQDKMSGVKRLKLHTISKPIQVKYCKHYLKGSCHQGDSCKYSHDIKKPEFCKYFLNNCLKGADCPYDHDPSKYPCHKYQSEGFCVRGAACQFSHKVPLANSSSAASDAKQKAELQGSAILGRQPNKGSTSKESLNMSKNMTRDTPASFGTIRHQGQNTVDLKPPAQAPKGISFLMFGNDSSKQPDGQCQSPPVGDNVASTCFKNQGVSERLYSSNKTSGRMSSILPVGQSSSMISDGKDKNLHNSAQKAQPSTSYESKKNDQSAPSTASNGNIPTISSILQDFLFVVVIKDHNRKNHTKFLKFVGIEKDEGKLKLFNCVVHYIHELNFLISIGLEYVSKADVDDDAQLPPPPSPIDVKLRRQS
ncbi:hypothetical protein IFM89_033048 [Coptis chinensis]|uniref:C3H1-type domain-containing protein n=1 Tax=Coptis chinensis TaxID=261450 RepID=A0A835IJU9_9MAGN|nr:hypothetical protein IFM89_033048 [Coptis chinensis]